MSPFIAVNLTALKGILHEENYTLIADLSFFCQ